MIVLFYNITQISNESIGCVGGDTKLQTTITMNENTDNHNVRLTLLVLGAHTLYSIPLAATEVKSQVHYANYIDRMELFHLEQIIAWKRVVRLS